MKKMGNYQWPLTLDALLDGGRTSEKWPLMMMQIGVGYRAKPGKNTSIDILV